MIEYNLRYNLRQYNIICRSAKKTVEKVGSQWEQAKQPLRQKV